MHAHVQHHTDKHTCTYGTHIHPPEQVNIKRICISGSGPVIVTTWEAKAGDHRLKVFMSYRASSSPEWSIYKAFSQSKKEKAAVII